MAKLKKPIQLIKWQTLTPQQLSFLCHAINHFACAGPVAQLTPTNQLQYYANAAGIKALKKVTAKGVLTEEGVAFAKEILLILQS